MGAPQIGKEETCRENGIHLLGERKLRCLKGESWVAEQARETDVQDRSEGLLVVREVLLFRGPIEALEAIVVGNARSCIHGGGHTKALLRRTRKGTMRVRGGTEGVMGRAARAPFGRQDCRSLKTKYVHHGAQGW